MVHDLVVRAYFKLIYETHSTQKKYSDIELLLPCRRQSAFLELGTKQIIRSCQQSPQISLGPTYSNSESSAHVNGYIF